MREEPPGRNSSSNIIRKKMSQVDESRHSNVLFRNIKEKIAKSWK